MTRGGIQLGNGAEPRFAAFISYSHADAAIAAKLQRKLEQYRLPRHVAALHPEQSADIGRIFRDREDLAAAPSLSDAIRDALAAAEALIVICSPDARSSHWVSQEIELFRKLHPDRPVLAALVRGEPGEAFPSALTNDGLEPLAADLRSEADGWSLGFLKIVAGIAGVPLDTLIQRDAQRRVRRVMWITVGALTAMLAMGVMTTLAISARNEAARQRAEAEGLVEYMLTDLRTRLKGVGRLDVMESVNDRAKEYYGNDSIKGRLLEAQLLHAMGEDFDKQGKLEQAEARFQDAHRQTAAILNSHPRNADVVFTHAQSEYWIGYVHYLRKDYRKSAVYWNNYKKQASQLATMPGEKLRGAMELGYANNNLCVLAVDSNGQTSEPAESCGDAVAAQRKISALNPSDPAAKLSLANSIAWLADAEENIGKLDRSQNLRNEQLSILEKLLKGDPKNQDYAEFRLTAMTALARLDRKSGRMEGARQRLAWARKIGAELKRHDPNNATWADRLNRIDNEMELASKGSTR